MMEQQPIFYCRFCGVAVAHARSKHESHCYDNPANCRTLKHPELDMRRVNHASRRDDLALLVAKSGDTRKILTVNVPNSMVKRIESYMPNLFPSRSEFFRAALLDHVLNGLPEIMDVPTDNDGRVITMQIPRLYEVLTPPTVNRSGFFRACAKSFLDKLDNLVKTVLLEEA